MEQTKEASVAEVPDGREDLLPVVPPIPKDNGERARTCLRVINAVLAYYCCDLEQSVIPESVGRGRLLCEPMWGVSALPWPAEGGDSCSDS